MQRPFSLAASLWESQRPVVSGPLNVDLLPNDFADLVGVGRRFAVFRKGFRGAVGDLRLGVAHRLQGHQLGYQRYLCW